MLTRIDRLLLGEYYYLDGTDECWCLREYTAGKGFDHGASNDLILNLKKSPERRDRPEWRYKEAAIRQVARELAAAIPEATRRTMTWVAMPPSKTRTDHLYDDRMVRVLRSLPNADELDIREVLQTRQSIEPAHSRLVQGKRGRGPMSCGRTSVSLRTTGSRSRR